MMRVWNVCSDDGRITPADASADGTMPTRAFRYCEAMRLAAGTGMYVQAPQDLDLMWDGDTIHFRQWDDGQPMEWQPLQPSAWLPGWDDKWNASAPPELQGMAPPTLTALREAGLVQITLGIAVQIPDPWRVWVRPPANLPRHPTLDFFEGIMHCDRARFAFINARITRTNVPVPLRVDTPLAQLVPVHGSMFSVQNRREETAAPWDDIAASIQMAPNDKPAGSYAVEERKRIKSQEAPPTS